MNPIRIPEVAAAARLECRKISMGPPQGVADEDCGTVEMLIAEDSTIRGYNSGRPQYAYYRPNEREIEILKTGGFIEFCQYGRVVQPFSATIWGGTENV